MATQSGLIYRKANTEGTESAEMAETLKSMEKMLQQLMEDRRKAAGMFYIANIGTFRITKNMP